MHTYLYLTDVEGEFLGRRVQFVRRVESQGDFLDVVSSDLLTINHKVAANQ